MRHKRRIMVCVTQQKSCERLIERGHELCRKGGNDELFVVHVVKENWKYFGQMRESDALEYLFDIVKHYEASLSVMKAADIEATLKKFAEDNAIDLIIMGESLEPTQQQNMIKRLQKCLNKDVAFEILTSDELSLDEAN